MINGKYATRPVDSEVGTDEQQTKQLHALDNGSRFDRGRSRFKLYRFLVAYNITGSISATAGIYKIVSFVTTVRCM